MSKKAIKSVLDDAAQVELAKSLILQDARLQVLESETNLSRDRLIRLYKEIHKKSPPKGMLPFSTDWYTTWQPNIHASLFLNIHEYLNKAAELDDIDTIIKAYKLYLEQTEYQGLEPMLSVTLAPCASSTVYVPIVTATASAICSIDWQRLVTSLKPVAMASLR